MKKYLLTGNQLKIIAAISMTLDHIGVQIFPEYIFLRVIGRLALPIFAYMTAEGCRYTKNKGRHIAVIGLLALICQLVYFFALGSLSQCILVTFSLSILLIYTLDNAVSQKNTKSRILFLTAFVGVYFITDILPKILSDTDFSVDYGFWGTMLAVFIYIGKSKAQKLVLAAVGLILLSLSQGVVQWFSLLCIPLLLLYSGKRGKANMKYFFYIYYPAHLVIIYLISKILQ